METCVGAITSQPLVHMRASMLISSPKKRNGKVQSYGTCMPSTLRCTVHPHIIRKLAGYTVSHCVVAGCLTHLCFSL